MISFPLRIGRVKSRPLCVGDSLLEAKKHSPQVTSSISGRSDVEARVGERGGGLVFFVIYKAQAD